MVMYRRKILRLYNELNKYIINNMCIRCHLWHSLYFFLRISICVIRLIR